MRDTINDFDAEEADGFETGVGEKEPDPGVHSEPSATAPHSRDKQSAPEFRSRRTPQPEFRSRRTSQSESSLPSQAETDASTQPEPEAAQKTEAPLQLKAEARVHPETEAREQPQPDAPAQRKAEPQPQETARATGTPDPGKPDPGGNRGGAPAPRSNGDLPAAGGGGGKKGGGKFHKRLGPVDFSGSMKEGLATVRRNLLLVGLFTCATNVLILAIPIYLFQISDRVLTSRSLDTLMMLTLVIVGAVILQAVLDAVRRFILMRTAVEVAAKLGSPILSAAARASLGSNGREYQTLGDLQQIRGFLVSGTLMSFLDVPFAPLFILAIYMVHPHLGSIVIATALVLLVIAMINQRITSKPFAEANAHQSRANLHLDSMARNSQIINALAMIPEAVSIWGRDTAASLTAQVTAQDRNIMSAACSRAVRLLTQIGILGWGAYLSINGEITGGMVIAASIIAGRALAPIEGAIEGWSSFLLSRAAYGRIAHLLTQSPLNHERLILPQPEGRLDVERLLYVPPGTKSVVLNGVSFALDPGESLAVIGNSGAGKTTLGKMLVGSVLPTSGCVRLDLMDLRNWDQRQLGENIGYLPQDVQLFPGTIKDNIARMRQDASDDDIHRAAILADVHQMISSFPQGYETYVAADGAPLSGGQKQRIALARAFFGDPTLLVLDEPNSNLDTAGDQALMRAMSHAKANSITVVVVTQKPSLLSCVDKILLMNEGSIAMFGARTKVLEALNQRKRPQQQGGQLGGQPQQPPLQA